MALNKKRLRAVRTDIPSKNYPKLTLQNAVDMVVVRKTGGRSPGPHVEGLEYVALLY
jgi:hypothetical protein